MLGTIPPGRVVVDLDSKLFVAYLTGYIPGEHFHSQAPLTVATSFLAAPDMTNACGAASAAPSYVAQAPLGFSGSVPSPRLTLTPLELLSDWLPFPCESVLPSPRVDVIPPSTTEPLPCCVRSPEARSAATCGGEAEHSSSHVHALCLKQTNVGGCQVPLVQQHPRVQGSFLLPEGLNLADWSLPRAISPRVLDPDGVSVAFRHLLR